MNSLDLSTHQLILNELAVTLAAQAHQGRLQAGSGADALHGTASSSSRTKVFKGDRRYLSVGDARTQIGLAQFATSISSGKSEGIDQHLRPLIGELQELLRALTSTEVEDTLDWQEWCLPDQLAFALVSCMLRVASNNSAPQQTYRSGCIDAVLALASDLSAGLSATTGDAHIVAVRLVPLFHGLYRAIASVSFPWSTAEFARLATAIAPLTGTAQSIRRLNDALLILPEQDAALQQANRATRRKPKQPTVRRRDGANDGDDDDDSDADARSEGSVETFFSGDDEMDEDEEELDAAQRGGFTDRTDSALFEYRATLLAHYRKDGRPLSGHFVLCAGIEILSSVLSQVLASNVDSSASSGGANKAAKSDKKRFFEFDDEEPERSVLEHDASATRKAWKSLLAYPIGELNRAPEPQQGTNGTAEEQQNGGFLSSLPIIGTGTKFTAAFGDVADAITGSGGASLSQALSATLHTAGRAYHDVHRFVDNEGSKQRGDLLIDVYALEILSEALKLGALCSVAQSRTGLIAKNRSVDSHTLVRIRTLLSEQASVFEPVLQGAALQCTGLLVLNFPSIAMPMTTQLRRFVTSPLAMFEMEPLLPSFGVPVLGQQQHTVTPILASAAKALRACVTAHGSEDLVVSTMYTLLNYLGKDGSFGGFAAGGAAGSGVSVRSGASRAVSVRDHAGMQHSGTLTSFATRTEEQKVAITGSTIAIVARLALEVGTPGILALTTSMLLQRLRTADERAEAAILANLVPLAVAGSKTGFTEVIRAYTNALRSALSGGAGRRASASVHAAQLRLASGLAARREEEDREAEKKEQQDDDEKTLVDGESADLSLGRKELYLVELLQLFAEKGQQLQTAASSGKASREELAELNTDLSNLLPTIAALLQHDDLNPQLKPTTEMVSLFRNMWFLSVLFGYATPPAERRAARNAASAAGGWTPAQVQEQIVGDSLASISLKTPTLVPETAHNYLESDLEYNSILRRDFSSTSIDAARKQLSALIPSHAGQIKSFKLAEVTFLQTIYDLECMRGSLGRPSMILWYFVNDGLNASSLCASMEAIADKVMQQFISDLQPQIYDHALDPRVANEVRNLFIGSVHRVAKVRNVSRRFLDRLIGRFPSLLCDGDLIILMLEMLTLLRQACESEYRDEYTPVYHFHSERAGVAFDLSDSYTQREEILRDFLKRTRTFLNALTQSAPVELQGILQRYLGMLDDSSLPGYSELGKSIALDYARSVSVGNRQETFLPALGGWSADSSSSLFGELTAKSVYLGEMTGIHLALTEGLVELQKDPVKSFSDASVRECKQQLSTVARSLLTNKSKVPLSDIRRLLYRTAALAVALPEVSPTNVVCKSQQC